MLYPAFLKKGDTIGVTATSGGARDGIDIMTIENGKKNLSENGYRVIETDNVRKVEKLVSSTGEQRAKEFYDLWCNEEVKHIIASAGGEFLMEMIPWLDKYYLNENIPKWVQGYSDTSLLLFYLTTKYNIATVHATNFGGYGKIMIDPTYMNTLEMISDDNEKVQESFKLYESKPIDWEAGHEFDLPIFDTEVEYKNLYGKNSEKISGRLIGGCIDAIKNIIGTPYDNTKNFCAQFNEGMIWYLENCEMNVCDLYRALWQMREAGWFENIKGFLIGRTNSKESINDFTYEDALHNALDGLKVPVIYDIDVGHTKPQWTMINGSVSEFEYSNGSGKLKTRFE